MSAMEARKLRQKAWSVPFSLESVALLQEAERQAADEEKELFEVRLLLCRHATFAGQPQIALVAFTWCLQIFDRNPNYSSRLSDLFWGYKFVLGILPQFPQISMEQMHRTLADFKKRLQQTGHSARTGAYYEASIALECGHLERGRALMDEWPQLKRDSVSNCHACEIDELVQHHHLLGNWAECLRQAEPLVRGQMRCAEVPQRTWPFVAQAHFRTGHREEAMAIAQRGAKATQAKPQFARMTALLIELYVEMNELPLALRLVERRLPWLDQSQSVLNRLRLMTASAILLIHVLKKEPALRLRLAPAFVKDHQLPNARGQTVLDWLRPQVERLNRDFDQRNGNAIMKVHFEHMASLQLA